MPVERYRGRRIHDRQRCCRDRPVPGCFRLQYTYWPIHRRQPRLVHELNSNLQFYGGKWLNSPIAETIRGGGEGWYLSMMHAFRRAAACVAGLKLAYFGVEFTVALAIG